MEFKHAHIAVFGLGKSGKAAVSLLVEQGAHVYAADDNKAYLEALSSSNTHTHTHLHIVHDLEMIPWHEISLLVLAPGVPLTHPSPHAVVEHARHANVPIVCDVELLWLSKPHAMFIGITGTNGKSTTTALVGHMLQENGKKVAVGGNIGTAAAELVAHDADIYVLELSSYQLDLLQHTTLKAAALLNITRDHIDRHGTMENYVAVKRSIFKRLGEHGIAIIATDDAHTRTIHQQLSCTKQTVHADEYMPFTTEKLAGKHNAQNIGVALQLCEAVGVAKEQAINALKSFSGLKHRSQWVRSLGNITFINDSKATNAEASAQALAAYENVYWIAGGRAKEGGIEGLSAFFGTIKKAYLYGEDAAIFAATLKGEAAYVQCPTLQNAVEQAFKDAHENGAQATILLSPAAASFDQFASFEARGDAFIEAAMACKV